MALSAKDAAGNPSSAAARAVDKRKRGSRSRKAAGATTATSAVGPNSPASSSRLKREVGGGDDHAAAEVRLRLAAMHARFGGELEFLVTEFTKMEAHLSPSVGNSTVSFRAEKWAGRLV